MIAARNMASDQQSLNSGQQKQLEYFKQVKDKHLLKAQQENLK